MQPTALAGPVLILAVLGGFGWEIAMVEVAPPYMGLGALAAPTDVEAVVCSGGAAEPFRLGVWARIREARPVTAALPAGP